MNPVTNTSPADPLTRADVPVQRPVPGTDLPPGVREAVAEIAADCFLAPDEYLDEVQVPFGGE